MANILDIANNEQGSSVRSKLNSAIAEANKVDDKTEKGGYTGTSQDLRNLIGLANGVVFDNVILTSRGASYDLTGQTDAQKATILQTAIDATGSLGWVYIPPGNYDRNSTEPTITISQREFTLFSFGRSSTVIDNTGGGHALFVDGVTNLCYRNTIQGFMCRTPKSNATLTGDAIHLQGSGVSSFRCVNMHVNGADRDAIHVGDDCNYVSIDCQVTETSLVNGIGRYTFYSNSQNASVQLTGGGGNKYYLDVNSNKNTVVEINSGANQWRTTYNAFRAEIVANLGVQNKFNVASNYETFRINDKTQLMPYGGNYLPITASNVYIPFIDVNLSENKVYAHSNNTNDGALSGNFTLSEDDFFGNILQFGGNSETTEVIIPHSDNWNLNNTFFFSFYYKREEEISGITKSIYRKGAQTIDITDTGRIDFTFPFTTFGNALRNVFTELNTWNLIFCYYDGTNFVVGNYNTNEVNSLNIGTDTPINNTSDVSLGRRFGNYMLGKLANWVIMPNHKQDYILGSYNMNVKSMNNTTASLDRAGRNKMQAPFNLATYKDANRPASADNAGAVIFNTTDGQINIWNGSNWTLSDGTVT